MLPRSNQIASDVLAFLCAEYNSYFQYGMEKRKWLNTANRHIRGTEKQKLRDLYLEYMLARICCDKKAGIIADSKVNAIKSKIQRREQLKEVVTPPVFICAYQHSAPQKRLNVILNALDDYCNRVPAQEKKRLKTGIDVALRVSSHGSLVDALLKVFVQITGNSTCVDPKAWDILELLTYSSCHPPPKLQNNSAYII